MYFVMLVSRLLFLMVFDWKTKHCASDVLQKSTSPEVSIFMIPESTSHDFGWPWDQVSYGSWHFWYPDLYCGMLDGFSLASWGPWGDPGTLGGTGKDTWRSRLGFLLIFDGFRNPFLELFWLPWTKKGVFVHACPGFFFW